MTRIGLVHAHDQHPDGELNAQTESRCAKALALYLEKKLDILFITARNKKDGALIALKMQWFFIRHKEVALGDIRVFMHAFNTAGEIGVAIRMAQTLFSQNLKQEGVRFTSISSWYHCPRIWILWARYGYFVRIAASGGWWPKDLAWEALKFFNSSLRPLKSTAKIDWDTP